jgi:hypothetical protein
MINCKHCTSSELFEVNAKVSDRCGYQHVNNPNHELNQYDGYVPYDSLIGGGDYIEFIYCVSCGSIQ